MGGTALVNALQHRLHIWVSQKVGDLGLGEAEGFKGVEQILTIGGERTASNGVFAACLSNYGWRCRPQV